mgnify:FL=1|jgi:hypothetical protein
MIDLIVAYPRNNDYPIWRDQIKEYRFKFNKVIVVFTESNDDIDFTDFVKKAMRDDDIIFLDTPPVRGEDWRNVAVNHALKYSDAEWVWFTEQDYFIKNGFWKYIDRGIKDADVIATFQGDRMHPCSMFVRKYVLAQTCLDFGIVPGVSDHFSLIQRDLERLTKRIDHIPEKFYTHLNGLSSNFTLVKNGGFPNYEKRAFNMYLNQCLDVDVPVDKRWVQIVLDYFDRL